MADFSFLSESDDEKAVDELLSQAMDHSLLQQISTINCSSFTDSVLPTHLETRFQKLKSFPSTNPKNHLSSSNFSSHLPSTTKSPKPQLHNGFNYSVGPKPDSDLHTDSENLSPKQEHPNGKNVLKQKLQSGFDVSPSKSSTSSRESGIFSPYIPIPNEKKSGFKPKSKSGSALSRSISSDISLDSPSSPTKTGCFWCSPKRKNNSKEKKTVGVNRRDWAKNDEFLSDLTTLSTTEQQKMLKKAMKEEAKISREAEKIVKWAKQASARMDVDVSRIELDALSDGESKK